MGRKAASCADCLAWGVLNNGRRCGSCSVWRHKHPGESACDGCGRTLAVKDGYCRLCWQQARYQSRLAGGLPRGAVSVLEDGRRLPWQQLFFDRMQLRRPHDRVRQHGGRGAPPKPPPAPAGRPAFRWIQPRLFEAWRDFTRFDEDADTDLGNPWLAWGLYLAWQSGEARGWQRGLRFSVRRALIIVLSRHRPGDTVRYSEIVPLQQALALRAGRTAEVLQEMGVLDDDRRPAFEDWLEHRLDGLAPGIRSDTEAWLRTLRDGGPRSRPRSDSAAWSYMSCLRPLLLAWSSQYGHLREVTRDDVLAAIGELNGNRRHNVLIALRSLFAFCKKRKSIFRSPVQGIRVGEYPQGVIQPMSQDEVDQAAEAAVTPQARLGLVLAAMHAARVKAIRELRLDDVDLGNRRITIGGRSPPARRAHARDPARVARLPHRPLAVHGQSLPAGQPPQRQWHRPRQHQLLRRVSTAGDGRHPGKAPRRPAAPGGPLRRPRPAAPGLGVRPRPQDRDPLRGKRQATARHRRRRARSRR